MANVQKERGYTPITNSILESLAKIRVSPEATRVLYVIFRLTYGYHKRFETISIKKFSEMTGLWKPSICRSLNRLQAMNLIIKNDNDKYSFQKDFDKWKLSGVINNDNGRSIINNDNMPFKNDNKSFKNDNKTLSKMIISTDEPKDSKDTSKDTTTKDTYIGILSHFNLACGKSLALTDERIRVIKNCIKRNRTPEQIKQAITNFSKDDWDGRSKHCDLVYAIGVRNKVDNFDKWIDYQPNPISSNIRNPKVSSHHPHAAPGKYAHLGKESQNINLKEEITNDTSEDTGNEEPV